MFIGHHWFNFSHTQKKVLKKVPCKFLEYDWFFTPTEKKTTLPETGWVSGAKTFPRKKCVTFCGSQIFCVKFEKYVKNRRQEDIFRIYETFV